MSYTDILKQVPTIQSAALLADNYSFTKKKKKTVGGFVGQGVKNIVGTSMIQEQAKLI